MFRKFGRKILLNPSVRKTLYPVVDFYNNLSKESLPEYLKANVIGKQPQFHVGGVMPFPDNDAIALSRVVEMASCQGMTVLEIGSWTGGSTNVLAKGSAKKDGSVFAIDHWQGSETVVEYGVAKEYDILSIFQNNMSLLGNKNVYPLVMPSQKGLNLIKDGSCDLIFIDGDHRYNSVKADILACLPKLKDGGIICGHDAEVYFSKCSENDKLRINLSVETDSIVGLCHPGVVKSLWEIFGDKHTIMPNSVVWYFKP